MNKGTYFLLACVCLVLAACSIESEGVGEKDMGNPKAKEILSNNQDADIFMYQGIVYSNAEDIEWVQEIDLTKGEKVKEIEEVYQGEGNFPENAATKLPVGTHIYESQNSGPLLIAEVDGELKPYLGKIEG